MNNYKFNNLKINNKNLKSNPIIYRISKNYNYYKIKIIN